MLNGMIKYIGTAVGVIGVEWFQSLPNKLKCSLDCKLAAIFAYRGRLCECTEKRHVKNIVSICVIGKILTALRLD